MLPTTWKRAHQFLAGHHQRRCGGGCDHGNGHDTAFLAQLLEPGLCLLIFRAGTCQYPRKIGKVGTSTCRLILDGRMWTNMWNHQAAIFNLGYLPSADKSVITLPAATIEAMEVFHMKGEWLLWSIMAMRRRHRAWCSAGLVDQLPQKDSDPIYEIKYQPPFLVMIEKLKSYRHG